VSATHVAPTLGELSPGFVAPAYESMPDRKGSYGAEAVDLIRIAGREPDPEQIASIDAMLSYGPGGRWAAFEECLIESRQHGKTDGVVLPVVLYDLFELSNGEDEFGEPDRIVWTAHLYKTAQDAFNSVVGVIESSYEFSRDVKKISYSHGEQGVELMNGASLEFMARQSGGGRGLGGKRVVFDEALILAASTMGAVMPLLSARANPKITYASSGAKADDAGAFLRGLIRRGRTGGPGLIYREYCAPGGWGDIPCAAELREEECVHGITAGCNAPPCDEGRKCTHAPGVPGCVFDRPDYWQKAGHSTGRRVTTDYLEAERRSLGQTAAGRREYGRERLGWHEWPPAEEGEPVVDLKQWSNLADSTTPPPEEGVTAVTVGIDVPPDASVTSVAVAWWYAGRRWVMVHRYQGTTDAPAQVAALLAKGGVIDCAMQTNGPAGAVFNLMKAAQVDVRPVPATEVAQGVGAWRAAVKGSLLGHLGQPELYAAQKEVKLRKVGDAVMWARDDLTDLSPLFAASIALNALGEVPEDDTGPNVW
jgi:hypothetical protein